MSGPALAGAPLRTFEDLPTVGLAELTASAALLTRVDRKYLLVPDDIPDVLAQLGPAPRVLDVGGVRATGYSSTYLDTPDLASFGDAAHARRRRWKVRTRRYASGGAFLEVKTRRGPVTVKERTPWSGPWPDAEGCHFVEDALHRSGVLLDAARLAPSLVTRYDRTTLLLPSGARATLDAGLCWEAPDGRRDAVRDLVVLETKSGHAPSELDRLLWRLGHRPVRFSKYAVGKALLDPRLQSNRWHRVLTTLAA